MLICYTPKYNPNIIPNFRQIILEYQMEAFENITQLLETFNHFLKLSNDKVFYILSFSPEISRKNLIFVKKRITE
jgi:hypothetical protein